MIAKTRFNKNSPVPLYSQLRDILYLKIKNGEWRIGEQIPSEDELCAQYNVSKTTVRQAIGILTREGLLRREQGRGTFVAEPKIEQGPLRLTSFTDEMRSRGLTPSSVVIEKCVIKSPPEVTEALELGKEDKVILLKRLRLANEEPMGVQSAYIPYELCPGLLDEKIDLSKSLYELLEGEFGISLDWAKEYHQVISIEEPEASMLRVPPHSPCWLSVRTTYDGSGRPIEFVKSIMRGDKYIIALYLVKREKAL
ncbi:MAG: GntR family transcriptional regulator [bacterium]